MHRFFPHAADPVSCGTHTIGALAAFAGGVFFLIRAVRTGAPALALACAMCFSLSMLALYTASAVYHYYPGTADSSGVKRRLRKMDHSMIYVLIAGSYTPVCLCMIQGSIGILILIIEWSMVFAGVLLKAIAKKSYPKLSVTIYMIMGWCAVLFLPALIAKANTLFLIFIVLGGIMYTIGVIFYSQPKHPYFHFIWHLFIILASIFHFIALIFFI